MKISIESLVVPAQGAPADLDRRLQKHIAAAAGVPATDVESYKILKRSVDARRKPDVKLLYKLVASLRDGARPALKVEPAQEEEPVWRPPEKAVSPALQEPLIVGAGPAGLFAALALAEAGCKPVVLERGVDVERRRQDVDKFFKTRELNPESNLLFGEGGAGTWSDGKLFTRVRDPRIRYVLARMVEAGAQEEILYFSHPHIGSDKLPGVVSAIRRRVVELGGRFEWGRKVAGVVVENGAFAGLKLSTGEILKAPAAVIASGHSARDLIASLAAAGVACASKGFQIGCRIEHPQEFVNFFQYGRNVAPPALGAADYNMSSKPSLDGRFQGATSFCMCPGGEIIPGVSDPGQLSTNGMSVSKRDGEFANAAIVSAVRTEFHDAASAFEFLNALESACFKAGGSDYSAPAQTAAAFLRNDAGKVRAGSYSLGVKPFDLNKILPREISDALKRALRRFDQIAPGFVTHGTLVGVETRVSSPVRFERVEGGMESSVKRLYIAGEGAGMAGGITSAAVDGVKAAEAMMSLNF